MSVTATPLQPLKRGAVAKLWVGIAVGVALAAGAAWAGTGGSIARNGSAEQFLAWHKGQPGVVTTASGLQYQVLKAGAGAKPGDADLALINYVGKLRDGSVFDQAQRAPLPVAGVVPGFSEGLKLMNRGAKYRFWIPPALGYGAQSPDPAKIPNDAVLVFDVDMLDFRSQAEVQAQMQQMQGLGAPGVPGQPQPGVGEPPR